MNKSQPARQIVNATAPSTEGQRNAACPGYSGVGYTPMDYRLSWQTTLPGKLTPLSDPMSYIEAYHHFDDHRESYRKQGYHILDDADGDGFTVRQRDRWVAYYRLVPVPRPTRYDRE